MEPLTECNLPGGKARQTSPVGEDDHQLRRARLAADARAGLGPAAPASRLMARTGLSGPNAPDSSHGGIFRCGRCAPIDPGRRALPCALSVRSGQRRRLRPSMTGLSASLGVAPGPLPSRAGLAGCLRLRWASQARSVRHRGGRAAPAATGRCVGRCRRSRARPSTAART
jgi:hypothetical protein